MNRVLRRRAKQIAAMDRDAPGFRSELTGWLLEAVSAKPGWRVGCWLMSPEWEAECRKIGGQEDGPLFGVPVFTGDNYGFPQPNTYRTRQ